MSTPLRVLVVDDHPDVADSLTRLLQAHGCQAMAASTRATALAAAVELRPHLVFLDLEMPDADGCALLAEMRRLGDALGQAHFVCLTGTSTAGAQERCLAAGFAHFVRKPIQPRTLADLLAAAGPLAA